MLTDENKIVGLVFDLSLRHDVSGRRIIDIVKKKFAAFIKQYISNGIDAFYLYHPELVDVCFVNGEAISAVGNYETDGWLFNLETALKQTLYVLETRDLERYLFLITDRLSDIKPVEKALFLNEKEMIDCHFIVLGIGQQYNRLSLESQSSDLLTFRHIDEISKEEIYGTHKSELINTALRQVQAYFAPVGLQVEQLYWAGNIVVPDAVLQQINAKIANEQAALAEAQRKAAEEAAAALKAINDEIGGLNRQWLETIGDTKALRELDLGALLSDEARAIQQRIWDYTDAIKAQEAAQEAAAKAAEEYNQRLTAARDALSQAYERESGAIQQTIDKFRDFAATIREFRLGLAAANDNSVSGSLSRFMDTARLARGGDSNAVSGFGASANSFLETALGQSRTRNEYQDQVAFVQRIAGGVEGSLGGQAGSAQMQLDLLKEQVGQFISLNDNVLTVKEAIANLQAIEAEQSPVVANTVAVGLDNVATKIEAATAKAENAEAMSRTALEAILKSSQAIERKLGGVRVEGGAWTVRTDDDTPLQTVAA